MSFACFLKTGSLIGISAMSLLSFLETNAQGEEWHVYFGAYTGEKSRGIYSARFDTDTGYLSQPQLAVELQNPSFLAVHPKGRILYAVSESDGFEGKHEGSVSAYAIDPKTGALKFLDRRGSGGTYPCHLSLDRKGKCLLVANYGSGSLAAFGVDPLGKFNSSQSVVQHQGSSVDPQRQTGPHAHFVTTDPDNRLAVACDLGLDKVLVYRLKPGKPFLTPHSPYGVPVEPGAGPRHLVFHPSGQWVYVLNEMGCSVDCFGFDSKRGALSLESQRQRTLPTGYKEPNTCAEIQIHPSGKFLYASNRGHNSIAAFSVDPANGQLTPIDYFSSGGKTPRHFTLDPSGKWLLAENQDSDNVVVFQVDLETGRLRPSGQMISIGKPVCAVFVEAKRR
jgi:6-phosphogluconolactonase